MQQQKHKMRDGISIAQLAAAWSRLLVIHTAVEPSRVESGRVDEEQLGSSTVFSLLHTCSAAAAAAAAAVDVFLIDIAMTT